MKKMLGPRFFDRSAVAVARDLLGKFLVRKRGGKLTSLMITETEAYLGFNDKASHAHRGRTERNAPMFGEPGRWYVYFTYGMHWLLNVVTGKKGHPAGVLIRGLEGLNGPARLTKALKINRTQNNRRADRTTGLWIEDHGFKPPRGTIRRTPRIGVDYAGTWAKKPYRFVLERECP